MSDTKTAPLIAFNFNAEILDIQHQMNFLKVKSVVSVREVWDHNKLLSRHGIPPLPERGFLGLPPHHLEFSEIKEVVTAIRIAMPKIDAIRGRLNQKIEEISEPIMTDAIEENSELVREWTTHFSSQFSDAPTAEEIQALKEKYDNLDEISRDVEPNLSKSEMREIMDEAIRTACFNTMVQRLHDLLNLQDRFGEIEIIAKSAEPGSPTSAYRYGFIAMMAAFDAAIFDLVRVALRKKFFELSSVFKNERKISIGDFADYSNFEDFKETIIEDQLHIRSVKDLLCLLINQWNVMCVDQQQGVEFGSLLEMINRRNVHLHNRGIVDEKYLETNIDQIEIGDIAVIDAAYWQRARDICTFCVREVVAWAKAD